MHLAFKEKLHPNRLPLRFTAVQAQFLLITEASVVQQTWALTQRSVIPSSHIQCTHMIYGAFTPTAIRVHQMCLLPWFVCVDVNAIHAL